MTRAGSASMEPFKKRTYRSFGEFAGDLRHLWARRKQVRRLTSGKGLDPAFRERIMLAVTRVNACRFCTFAHSRAALQAGMDGHISKPIDADRLFEELKKYWG